MAVTQAAIIGASSILSFIGAEDARKATNRAVVSGIERKGRALLSETLLINQQLEDIDRDLGDTLSAQAIETAKLSATSRALAASSGTTGGTTETTSKQAFIDQTLAEQQIISKARSNKVDLLRRQLINRISFRNEADALRSGLLTSSQAQLGAFASSFSGATQGLSLLNVSQQASALNIGQSNLQSVGNTVAALPTV